MIGQQPPVVEVLPVAPIDWHGPAIPVVGMARLGNEIVGVIGLAAGSMLDSESIGIGLGARPVGSGLSPPPPISTEPRGIPTREVPPGDVVDIVDDMVVAPVELVSQVPDAGMPPVGGIPIVIPPPSDVAAVPDIPVDVPVGAGHANPLPVVPIDTVGIGLRPTDGSSVAPMPSPVGGTGVVAVMPIGEVAPMAGTVSTICASAGLWPNRSASVAASTARRGFTGSLIRWRYRGTDPEPSVSLTVRTVARDTSAKPEGECLSAIGVAAQIFVITACHLAEINHSSDKLASTHVI
jgi:hypothetical protein